MSSSNSKKILIPLFLCLAFMSAHAQEPVSLEGLVTPEREVDLASPSEGLLLEVLVKDGAAVSASDPIAKLTSEEEQIQLHQAELNSRQMEEDLQSIRRLYDEKAASRDDLNRATLTAGRAAAERDLLAIRLRNRTISSPVAGHVLRVLKDPGESVQRLEKVAEIVALDRKFVTAYADASLFGSIPAGAETEILLTPDSTPLKGRVEMVDPILDAGGGAFRVKILVEDSEGLLKVGTRVPVRILAP
jgi:RND family efflux transporter MFP subunit